MSLDYPVSDEYRAVKPRQSMLEASWELNALIYWHAWKLRSGGPNGIAAVTAAVVAAAAAAACAQRKRNAVVRLLDGDLAPGFLQGRPYSYAPDKLCLLNCFQGEVL